jgi:hypothetical protein
MTSWKINALALATVLGIAYVSCALFDILFPPYGMLVALAPISPWPLFGSPLGLLTGFLSFTVAGLLLGAIYGAAWDFLEPHAAAGVIQSPSDKLGTYPCPKSRSGASGDWRGSC